jgi:hypothetical protein
VTRMATMNEPRARAAASGSALAPDAVALAVPVVDAGASARGGDHHHEQRRNESSHQARALWQGTLMPRLSPARRGRRIG